MEILKFLYSNFGKTLLILIWVICGAFAIVVQTPDSLLISGFITICYGCFHVIVWLSE